MSEFSSLSPNSGDIMEELDMTVVSGAEEGEDPLTTSPSLNGMMFMARNTYSPMSLEGIFSRSSTEESSESRLSEKTVSFKVNISFFLVLPFSLCLSSPLPESSCPLSSSVFLLIVLFPGQKGDGVHRGAWEIAQGLQDETTGVRGPAV